MKPNPVYMTKITSNDRFNYEVASDGFKVNIALGATATAAAVALAMDVALKPVHSQPLLP